MNSFLVNKWFENKDRITEEIFKDLEFFHYNTYQTFMNLMAKHILGINEFEEYHDYGNFGIKATIYEKDYKYTVYIYGEISYGTCDECDLFYYLNGRKGGFIEAVKMAMLNMIQVADVEIQFDYEKEYLVTNNIDINKDFDIFMMHEELKKDILKTWADINMLEKDCLFSKILAYFYLFNNYYNDENIKKIFEDEKVFENLLILTIPNYFHRKYPIKEALNNWIEDKLFSENLIDEY